MYLSSRSAPPDVALPADAAVRPSRGNVVALGFTSLFTDLAAESVTAILPLYLTLQLGLGPLAFGAFDGAYQALAGLLALGGGLAADRWRRHKEVAAVGYGLSAGCRLGLLAAGTSWPPILGVLYLDRLGKGMRTAPRDAMISLSSTPRRLAEDFGVHRALDTTGALLGPLVAFGLLVLLPGAYDVVFVTSFCAALVGFAVLVLFVDNRRLAGVRAGDEPPRSAISARSAIGLLRIRRFRMVTVAGAVLGLVTLSDAFAYLALQRRTDLDASLFPLLYVGTALVYLCFAVPVGRLADRVGRAPVYLGGHLVLLGGYAVLLLPLPNIARAIALVGFLGLAYAATGGVLMAMASAVIPARARASGLAVLAAAIGVSRLGGSLLFGGLWNRFGPELAVVVFVGGLTAALVAAAAILRPGKGPERPAAGVA